MKKIILLALTTLMMVGCSEYFPNPSKSYEEYVTVTYIDSCEYLRTKVNAFFTFTHKGNCRFCKERRQKEFEELVTKLKEK